MWRRKLPTLHLGQKSLKIALAVATLCTLSVPAVMASWRFNFFLAPLVIATYRCSPVQLLWLAASCGIFIDLLSAPYPMGLYTTAYTCAGAALLRCKNHFFADTPSTMPILVTIAALTSTLALEIGLLLNTQQPFPSTHFFLIDGLALALSDALLATTFFIVPALWLSSGHSR